MIELRSGLKLLLVTLFVGLGATSTPLQAQSSLSGRGLGLPTAPTDARNLGIGGVSLGLPGASLSATDPAAIADLVIPAIGFTFQTSWANADNGVASDDFSGTRFPFVGVSYPSRFGVLFVHAGGLLDQRSRSTLSQEIPLEGTNARAQVTDEFSAQGGVSTVRFGIAGRFGPALSVSAFGGRNLGSTRRSFTRTFDSLDIEVAVPPFTTQGEWKYRGWTGGFGMGLNVGSFGRVAATYTWSSVLDAVPTEATEGEGRSYAMPSDLRVGASAILAPGLMIAGAFERAAWSVVDGDLITARASDAMAWGGGLEWQLFSIFGKPSTVRFGYRSADLPFRGLSEPEATESALTGGLGIDLLTSRDVLLARLDLGLEQGTRIAGDLNENFLRLSTSLRISGF
jgi:hypothetical protein